MKTGCGVFAAVAFSLIGMYGCSGCTETNDYFAFIANTLTQPVTVEFRSFDRQTVQRTITIEPNQDSVTFTYRNISIHQAKVGSCDDYYEAKADILKFSNATLGQYAICNSNSFPHTYAVLAVGSACPDDYPMEETTGW